MSSENKNEMDEKFIERSMYEGKSSKNPMLPLLGNLALAVGILAFGIYYYLELIQWEKEGGTIKMNRFIKLLYEMGGSITVLLLFVGSALYLVYEGYSSYKPENFSGFFVCYRLFKIKSVIFWYRCSLVFPPYMPWFLSG